MASEAVSMAANIAQLTGVDALGLITMIVEAAKAARRNKRTCLELARLVEQVGDLLRALQEQPGVTVMERPETSAPLRELQETLRRAHELVESCRRRGSYPRRLFAGKEQGESLREVQSKISIYLQLFPIICHIDGTRLLVRVIADGAAAARSPRPEVYILYGICSAPTKSSSRYGTAVPHGIKSFPIVRSNNDRKRFGSVRYWYLEIPFAGPKQFSYCIHACVYEIVYIYTCIYIRVQDYKYLVKFVNSKRMKKMKCSCRSPIAQILKLGLSLSVFVCVRMIM